MHALLEEYFADDDDIHIVTDWPEDVKYFSEVLITGPGKIINIPDIRFDVVRVDAYPTELKGAVQHNAIWDALALRFHLTQKDKWEAFKPKSAAA